MFLDLNVISGLIKNKGFFFSLSLEISITIKRFKIKISFYIADSYIYNPFLKIMKILRQKFI